MNVHEINSRISNCRMMIQQTQNELDQHWARLRQSAIDNGVPDYNFSGDGTAKMLSKRITEYHREISELQKQLSSAGR